MPTRDERTVSGVDWAVYCKPICTESQRKGIQRSLSETTEKDGLTMVEQDRVRTIIRMNKARKYDAAKEFLQKMLKRFPGTGATGLWTLHLVSVGAHGDVERSSTTSSTTVPPMHSESVGAHGDAQSSSMTAPPIYLASFPPAPALALKCALLSGFDSKGAQLSQSPYALSKECIGSGSYGRVWVAVGSEQAVVAIKSFKDKQEAGLETRYIV